MRISKELHCKRMAQRRARQLARRPGFTPMPNKRINTTFDAAIVLAAIRKPHGTAVEHRQWAHDHVASQLPKAQPSKVGAIHRMIARGSRDYRTGLTGERRFAAVAIANMLEAAQ